MDSKTFTFTDPDNGLFYSNLKSPQVPVKVQVPMDNKEINVPNIQNVQNQQVIYPIQSSTMGNHFGKKEMFENVYYPKIEAISVKNTIDEEKKQKLAILKENEHLKEKGQKNLSLDIKLLWTYSDNEPIEEEKFKLIDVDNLLNVDMKKGERYSIFIRDIIPTFGTNTSKDRIANIYTNFEEFNKTRVMGIKNQVYNTFVSIDPCSHTVPIHKKKHGKVLDLCSDDRLDYLKKFTYKVKQMDGSFKEVKVFLEEAMKYEEWYKNNPQILKDNYTGIKGANPKIPTNADEYLQLIIRRSKAISEEKANEKIDPEWVKKNMRMDNDGNKYIIVKGENTGIGYLTPYGKFATMMPMYSGPGKSFFAPMGKGFMEIPIGVHYVIIDILKHLHANSGILKKILFKLETEGHPCGGKIGHKKWEVCNKFVSLNLSFIITFVKFEIISDK